MPYTHTSNPLCERQNQVLEQNLRILMKKQRTKDWVHPLPWVVLTMNFQESSPTGYTHHELFHGGRHAWFFKMPFPEDYKSPVGDWLEHRQDLANLARANLKHVRERELTRRNRTRRSATFKVGVKVLPWVVEGAGGLGAGKTSGAGTRGVSLDVVIGGRTGYSDTNGGESSNN